MNGILNVLKPPGMTSSDVVVYLRKHLGIRKTGHTGTLDPEAAGVLPVCLGKATKIADYIMHQDKVYRCGMKLGITTDTSDLTGEILSKTADLPGIERITDVLLSFQGESEQIPPMHSAIKIGGKKLYQLARQGVELDVPPRKIQIHEIRPLSLQSPDFVLFEVRCSKGTYIRALCKDIGEALGCGAAMSFLVRTRTGAFSVEESSTLDEILSAFNHGTLNSLVLPMEKALERVMPAIVLKESCMERIRHGNSVSAEYIQSSMAGIAAGESCSIFCGETFMGIGYYMADGKRDLVKMKNVLI
jgi:tRNA pseudouridine55 synthase